MLPGRLIISYWKEVRGLLRERHGLTVVQARRGISIYRARMRKHEVGDILYHEDSARTAETIAGLVRQGLLDNPERFEPVPVDASSQVQARRSTARHRKQA
jgi:hypothetical protein